MSKAPAMPLFVGSYKQDTDHLTLEEHGAYLLLLMAMWSRDGTIPDDDDDIARLLHVTRRKWLQLKPRLMPFLEQYGPSNSRILTQKRLQKEWNSCAEYREAQRTKSARGGEATRKRYQEVKEARGLLSGLGPKDGLRASPKARPEREPGEGPPFPIKEIISSSEYSEPREAIAASGAVGVCIAGRESEIPHRLQTALLAGRGPPPSLPKRKHRDRRH